MVWYNPLSWFEKQPVFEEQPGEYDLIDRLAEIASEERDILDRHAMERVFKCGMNKQEANESLAELRRSPHYWKPYFLTAGNQ